ncbi:MAG TPA: toll/interleukin-1 receptor domain-containing protein [Candidatus Angelobacter sp.]|jgi:hypothetical protein
MKAAPAGSTKYFYLYSHSSPNSTLSTGNVFYRVADERSAKTLCRLFFREYASEGGKPYFSLKCADEVDLDEQIFLDEALDMLDIYDDPDPGVYDHPPTRETLMCAEYARRARKWEVMVVARNGSETSSPINEGADNTSDNPVPEATEPDPEQLQMPAEDRRNAGLNLLFLLAQAYYKILESVVSTASWCCALDLDLNESYLWTIVNLSNLLTNHKDLRNFPGTFEPAFPDLFPSTIRDLDWEDMVAPGVEHFLSTVQGYVRSQGMYPPGESSPGWIFVELFRPSINIAIERAVAYNKRMRKYIQSAFSQDSSVPKVQHQTVGAVMKTAFISYSWDDDDHREWVCDLAKRLRADGVAVSIDRWEAVPGDQLPAFMERAIRDNQFVVIICTPRYKRRSDAREGGVGYEGDIMTAEVMSSRNNRKFIPVLRSGEWALAAPSWLTGKYHINLTGDPYSERDYEDLVRTLLGIRETAPPIGKPMATIIPSKNRETESVIGNTPSEFQDIKITRVIVEDITEPRNDGTRGSALYSIPFALSCKPASEWVQLFIASWNHPPRFTTMHRPGIASVYGATITLNGTTIEEVERYHRDTLQLAVAETNKRYRELSHEQQQHRAREEAARDEHRKRIEDASKRIKF